MKRLLVLLAGCTTAGSTQDAAPGTDPCDVVLDSYGAAIISEQQAEQQGNYVGLIGAIDTDPGINPLPEVFSLELYSGDSVGTHTIEGIQTQYATCSVCVVLYADYEEDSARGGMYQAVSGTVTLTEVSPRLVGSVADLTFEHVTLDDELTSTPHMDQCVTSMASLAFDAEIAR